MEKNRCYICRECWAFCNKDHKKVIDHQLEAPGAIIYDSISWVFTDRQPEDYKETDPKEGDDGTV